MRILIGVLASELPIYRRLVDEGLRKTWARNVDPDVEILYYYRGSNTTVVDGAKVFFDSPEGIFHLAHRTAAFFEYILANKRFDFLFRTNVSSYVNIANLRTMLSDKPRQGFFNAVVGDYHGRPFASGAGYVLTPDLIQLAVDHRQRWIQEGYDDVSLSFALQDLGIALRPGRRQDFETVQQVEAIDTSHYHFRCKSFDDSERRTDCQIMQRIHEILNRR
jgi:hypothetical protein